MSFATTKLCKTKALAILLLPFVWGSLALAFVTRRSCLCRRAYLLSPGFPFICGRSLYLCERLVYVFLQGLYTFTTVLFSLSKIFMCLWEESCYCYFCYWWCWVAKKILLEHLERLLTSASLSSVIVAFAELPTSVELFVSKTWTAILLASEESFVRNIYTSVGGKDFSSETKAILVCVSLLFSGVSWLVLDWKYRVRWIWESGWRVSKERKESEVNQEVRRRKTKGKEGREERRGEGKEGKRGEKCQL